MLVKFMATAMALALTEDKRERKDERGATATEYGLLVALIAFVIIVGVLAFGNALSDFFTAIGGVVADWGSTGPA